MSERQYFNQPRKLADGAPHPGKEKDVDREFVSNLGNEVSSAADALDNHLNGEIEDPYMGSVEVRYQDIYNAFYTLTNLWQILANEVGFCTKCYAGYSPRGNCECPEPTPIYDEHGNEIPF